MREPGAGGRSRDMSATFGLGHGAGTAARGGAGALGRRFRLVPLEPLVAAEAEESAAGGEAEAGSPGAPSGRPNS